MRLESVLMRYGCIRTSKVACHVKSGIHKYEASKPNFDELVGQFLGIYTNIFPAPHNIGPMLNNGISIGDEKTNLVLGCVQGRFGEQRPNGSNQRMHEMPRGRTYMH